MTKQTVKKKVDNATFWENSREDSDGTFESEVGNPGWRMYLGPFTRRRLFDDHHCTLEEGWRNFETAQDAPYFGIWTHEERRQIVTFAEGDLSVVECLDEAMFSAELFSMRAFYNNVA